MDVAGKPIVMFSSVDDWERFLADDPPSHGVRLRLRKKASTVSGITYAEALDIALCHGWIDGQVNALDDSYFEGRMRPAGQAEIDRAKADGRWDAAYRQADADVPEAFQRALDVNPRASAVYAASSSRNRFAMAFRIQTVKRAETRDRKIAEYIAMLERGDTLHT